jgi:hypothetical protein
VSDFDSVFLVVPTDGNSLILPESLQNSGIKKESRVVVRTDRKPINFEANEVFPTSSEINIYKWWNLGINFGKERDATIFFIMNDDVKLEMGQLQAMFKEFQSLNPVILHSKNSNGGRWGHAFFLDTSFGVYPDESFKWWYGDDDLLIRSKRVGRVIESELEILHLSPNQRTRENIQLQKIARKDLKIFRKKYFLRYLLICLTKFKYSRLTVTIFVKFKQHLARGIKQFSQRDFSNLR